MIRTWLVFIVVSCILLFNLSGFTEDTHMVNLFGIRFGENTTLDQIHQKNIGGTQISTISMTTYTTVASKTNDSRQIIKKIDFKCENTILLQSKVKFLDRPNLKDYLPFSYLCDGANYWSDDNAAKKMNKLGPEPRRLTYYFVFENLITQKKTTVSSFKQLEQEYQITTVFEDGNFQSKEEIIYFVAKDSLFINRIRRKFYSTSNKLIQYDVEYSKYMQIGEVYVPKRLKATTFMNGEMIETAEEEIDTIEFNQSIPDVVFRP